VALIDVRDNVRRVDKDEIPMAYENIQTETKGRVGVIRFHRPQALNALNAALVEELIAAIDACEADVNIGCLLITGSDKAFAAGADIKEMVNKTYQEANMQDFGGGKDRIARCRKPVVAAVAGFALGGGCEFAMQADIIIAADTAKFGQPEIKLGVIPGYGGTAERSGLVARVVPAASLMEEAMKVAETIAGMGLPSVYAAKESVNRAFETSLAEGARFERRVFQALFATEDQKEGMSAFIEKRPAKFKNK
jgi:enoyl-CoA hydratase